MSDAKQKINKTIDRASRMAKGAAARAVDMTKQMVRMTGQRMQDAGRKLKQQAR